MAESARAGETNSTATSPGPGADCQNAQFTPYASAGPDVSRTRPRAARNAPVPSGFSVATPMWSSRTSARRGDRGSGLDHPAQVVGGVGDPAAQGNRDVVAGEQFPGPRQDLRVGGEPRVQEADEDV